jgi:hypothetical protein
MIRYPPKGLLNVPDFISQNPQDPNLGIEIRAKATKIEAKTLISMFGV